MKRLKGAEGGAHEGAGMMRWLLTYADMITLLLVFFIVLYAISQVNKYKYETLIKALHQVLNGQKVQPYVGASPKSLSTAQSSAALQKLAQEIQSAINQSGDQSQAQVVMEAEGIRVTFEGSLLFAEGQATILPQGKPVLKRIAALLAPVSNRIVVEGYTDSLPIHTARFHSNWDLAAIRATTVLSYLIGQGVGPARFAAEAFGRYRPVASNATPQGRQRNRRVDVVILKPAQPPDAPPAGTVPSSPVTPPGIPTQAPGLFQGPLFPVIPGTVY